jgi:hypothetical protein
MARPIRAAARHGSCVHVSGWEHLVGLAEMLAELSPQVRLLKP